MKNASMIRLGLLSLLGRGREERVLISDMAGLGFRQPFLGLAMAVFLLSLYLAVFPMLAAGLAWRIGRQNPLPLVLALSGLWALTEWLRAGLFTGFAWNPVGVTFIDHGFYAISGIIVTSGLSGNGLYTQDLYYKVLDTGEWIPPSAGSASGVLPNPVGYNRIYARVGKDANWDGFWMAVREGRSFVTNGPLLRVQADGKDPGAHFNLATAFRMKNVGSQSLSSYVHSALWELTC